MTRKPGKKYKIADVNHVFAKTQRPEGIHLGAELSMHGSNREIDK